MLKSRVRHKSIVDSYNIEIYDVVLVVANKYTTLESLKQLYVFVDDTELNEEIMSAECSTSTCKDKKTGAFCILVKYNGDKSCKTRDKKLNFINTCSHEATHVCLDIYEAIGQNICYCSPEPLCYLQAWAMECIYKTLSK